MRLAVDASRTTVARLTGTEHYALELIRALIRRADGHQITLYFRDAPLPNLFPPVEYRVLPQRRLWTHTRFAAALWHDRPDVTFVPAHTLPFVFPGRAGVTVHDLGFRTFPGAHPAFERRYLDATTRYSASRAGVILADSRATADDLTRFYGTAPDKIHVVYPGVARPPTPSPQEEGERKLYLQRKYGIPERYFVFIGTLQPRKNIARMVQAYRIWREVHPGDPAALVLAGGKGWLYDESWMAGVDGVILTGYIDEADKGALLGGALALVFPSLYEGFGFPVIEAMHCDTPVLCSGTSSLPELAGDAALLVDPLDVEAIADGMARLSDDAALRESLVAGGRVQAARFTWDAAAAAALVALEAAAGR